MTAYVGCETLRVWNRLEVRPRDVEFDQALQARLADPLWLLTRQWQFGEFHAEDGGSPVLATLASRSHPVDRVRLGSAAAQPYSPDDVPLEPLVEALPPVRTAAARAQAGTHLLRLIEERLREDRVPPYTDGEVGEVVAGVRGALADLHPLTRLDLDSTREDHALSVAARRAAARADRVLLALARARARVVDGVAFAESLPAGRALTWNDVPGSVAAAVPPAHAAIVLSALTEFRDTLAESAPAGPLTPSGAWDFERLEYVHGARVNRGTDTIDLAGAPSSSGRLDWYSFDVEPAGAQAPAGPATGWEVATTIPTPVEFAGMPSPRWWEFEDHAVTLADMHADPGDLPKLLVQSFALRYGNNWLLVPLDQKLGTLTEVAGIVVDDVFGVRTLVTAATGGSGSTAVVRSQDWARWDLFSLSPRRAGTAAHPNLGQHLFLPPALPGLVEGPVLEEVGFVRDEMSNLVWAVESRVPDGLRGSTDGAQAARAVAAALDRMEAAAHPEHPDEPTDSEQGALTYTLATTVPRNWIPFLPVHCPSSTHEIRLQRASMPQFFPPGAPRVRPVTSILREGMADPSATAGRYPDRLVDADPLPPASFLNEEEVPRSGVVVRGRMQRGRWIGGTTVAWYGRQVTAGRGEGSSGLLYDTVTEPGKA